MSNFYQKGLVLLWLLWGSWLGSALAQEQLVVSTSTNNVDRNVVNGVARYDALAQGVCRIDRATIEADLNAGLDVLLHSAEQISIEATITKTSGADTRITFQANDFVAVRENVTSTSGQLDIIIWSDYDDYWNESGLDGFSHSNFVLIKEGITLNSNGGTIVIAGGRDDGTDGRPTGDGIPDGFAFNGSKSNQFPLALDIPTSELSGVQIGRRGSNNATISILSEGGDIDIRGRTGGDNADRQDQMPGISSQRSFIIDAGAGQITMYGYSRWFAGIEFTYGQAPNFAIRSSSDASPAISIKGITKDNGEKGVWMSNVTSGNILIQSESLTAGGIEIYGDATNDNSINLGPATTSDNNQEIRILSAAGMIDIIGDVSSGTDHLRVNCELFLGADNTGTPPTVQGITPITSSSANVRVRANDLDFSASNVDVTEVYTTGKFVMMPRTASADLTFPTLMAGLTLSGISELVVGDDSSPSASQPSVFVQSAMTADYPVTMYGDQINFTSAGAITLTEVGDALNLLSQTFINGTTDVSLSTNGGNITLATDIEDGSNGDYIVFDRGLDIQSNGGNITLGGEDITASGYARGTSIQQINHPSGEQAADNSDVKLNFACGIVLDGDVDILSGGGDITLRGKSLNTSNDIVNGWGVGSNSLATTKTFNSGTGKIYIEGVSEAISAVDRAMGQYWGGNLEVLSASTASDAIQLIGTVTGGGDNDFGFEFNDDGDATDYLHIYATGAGGGILIQGDGGTSSNRDIFFNSQAQILANGGPIVIEGKATRSTGIVSVGSGNTLILAAAPSTSITASSSNVTLRGNSVGGDANAIKVNTSGNLTCEPATVSASFNGNISTSVFDWNPSSGTVTDLTIGKSGNAVNVGIEQDAITVSGDVNLYGNTVLLNRALTIGQTLNIEAGAGVSQLAAFTADAVSISGTGAVTLTNAANDVNTFAAGGVGLSNVSYTDADGFTVGAAGSLSGISCSGLIDMKSLNGDITIANNISTGSNSSTAVLINADSDESAGNDGSGNIIISGTPTISVPNGEVYFFTGTQAASTGLLAFVGGTSNAVNNADETNYTTAMTTAGITPAAGQMYAIYRQTAALPVEFMYFRATCDGLQAQLEWATAMEDNNDYFEVERSNDGYEWSTIGRIEGAGTSLTEQHYEYIDLTPAAGLRYYRLRQVDYDGAYEYSPIISVSCKSGNTVSEPFLYPNPAYDVTTIVVPSATGLLQVRNALGQLVHEQNILGTHTILSVAKFQAGLYYITIQEGATRRTLPLLVD